jgi:hypothetical protein
VGFNKDSAVYKQAGVPLSRYSFRLILSVVQIFSSEMEIQHCAISIADDEDRRRRRRERRARRALEQEEEAGGPGLLSEH